MPVFSSTHSYVAPLGGATYSAQIVSQGQRSPSPDWGRSFETLY